MCFGSNHVLKLTLKSIYLISLSYVKHAPWGEYISSQFFVIIFLSLFFIYLLLLFLLLTLPLANFMKQTKSTRWRRYNNNRVVTHKETKKLTKIRLGSFIIQHVSYKTDISNPNRGTFQYVLHQWLQVHRLKWRRNDPAGLLVPSSPKNLMLIHHLQRRVRTPSQILVSSPSAILYVFGTSPISMGNSNPPSWLIRWWILPSTLDRTLRP